MTTKPKKKAAVAAQQSEAEDGYVTIEHCGLTFRIGVGDDVPLELMELVDTPEPQTESETRKLDIALTKAMLGPEQWKAFQAIRPSWRDYLALGKKINEASGN